MVTAAELLDNLYFSATSEADQGTKFERPAQALLAADLTWADRFSEVWMWEA